MESGEYDEEVSFILLGDIGVGKTTLGKYFFRILFLGRSYIEGYPMHETSVATMSLFLYCKNIKIDGKKIKVIMKDTSGEEKFRSLTKSYLREGEGVFIVYDITNENSLESVKYWLEEINDKRSDYPSVMIVGNKSDKEKKRKVSEDKGRQFAKEVGAGFVETNSK